MSFFNKISVGLLLTLAVISSLNAKTTQSEKWLKTALDRSEYQLLAAAEKYKADKSNPRTCENGKVVFASPKDWTCGFFPGSLWYMYELTGMINLKLKQSIIPV